MTVLRYVGVRLELLAAVVIVTVASVLLWEQVFRPDQLDGAEDPGIRIDVADLTMRFGDAGVILIEFGDFQCTFCARQATGVHPAIQRQFIDTGTLSYAYVHFPLEDLHPGSDRSQRGCGMRGQAGAILGDAQPTF